MIIRLLRSLTPVLLALCVLFSIQTYSQTSALARKSPGPTREPLDPNFVPDEEQRRNYIENRGNDIVHEVWSVLRDFESTWKDSVVSTSPTGFVATLWHYAKILFRTLFMNAPSRQKPALQNEEYTIKGDLKNGVESLKAAATFDDPDAIFLLAEMNFHGNYSHPRNMPEAFKWYTRLADLDGNSTAQYILGLMYATGIGGVEQDQAKSLLYHNFAAEQGNIRSEMTLAFKHHSGIGTTRECDKAVGYYKRVADKAMDYWYSGPPGGHTYPRNSYRWVEVNGGIYGEGASASSSGPNARGHGAVTTNFDDVLEYLSIRESSGDFAAALTIGKHYYEAPRGYRRNLRKAQRQFMKVARTYWLKDGKINPKAPKGIDKVAGKAAAYIGRMFLRGEGMERDYEKAITWFRRGIDNGDSFAQYHLGLMYRDGLGLPKDGVRAGTLLKAAAEQGLPIAQSALGVLFLDQGDLDTAGRYFELAAGSGIMEAFYYLAELTNQGIGRDRNCGLASVYYKVVAEKAELIHSAFPEANTAYERGDLERALIGAIMAAEQGYEHAQANVAYLLDQQTSVVSLSAIPFLSWLSSSSPVISARRSRLLKNRELALVYFTRSSKQANVDSLVKMGDYYLSGVTSEILPPPISIAKNTTNSTIQTNLEKAASCYTAAAEGHHSAQALWNLGWMHENGIGSVTQDFHMAKRYYDLAYEMNKEAYLPVKLALTKLRIRSWWNGVSGGKINPIREDDDEDTIPIEGETGPGKGKKKNKKPKTWAEWFHRFLDAADEMDAAEHAAAHGHQHRHVEGDVDADDIDYDNPLFHARAADPNEAADRGMPGGDNDYHYTGAHHQRGEADEWEEFDDGLVESLIIIALAGALAALVYARQARQRAAEDERRRRVGQGLPPLPPAAAVPQTGVQQQALQQVNQAAAVDGEVQGGQVGAAPPPGAGAGQGQGVGQNGGFFPQPGDPELNNWVVGGVGH